MSTGTSIGEPWVLVLDDDPTGTQGIAGVPVVIHASEEAFQWTASLGGTASGLVTSNTGALGDANGHGCTP